MSLKKKKIKRNGTYNICGQRTFCFSTFFLKQYNKQFFTAVFLFNNFFFHLILLFLFSPNYNFYSFKKILKYFIPDYLLQFQNLFSLILVKKKILNLILFSSSTTFLPINSVFHQSVGYFVKINYLVGKIATKKSEKVKAN